MNSITLIQHSGFKINVPSVEFMPFSEEKMVGIHSRKFGSPYENINDQISGNLYLWLQQTYSVLWQIRDENVLIYANTVHALGERFGTLMKVPKIDGMAACFEMFKALAISNYIIEKTVYKMEGNWLLKHRNKELSGSLQYFLFWLAKYELKGNEMANRALDIFMEKFAKDVDMKQLESYSTNEIIETFIQCFFNRNNETKILFSKLEKPNCKLNDLISLVTQ
jgi:hypothetical protein